MKCEWRVEKAGCRADARKGALCATASGQVDPRQRKILGAAQWRGVFVAKVVAGFVFN